MSGHEYEAERQLAVQAARTAGEALMERRSSFSVEFKGPNDLVTEADREAQEIIRTLIARRFPEDSFLGEEGVETGNPDSPRRWIVDPLDGTTNYVHDFPFFCSSVGFAVGRRVVAGAIYDPFRRELFDASLGGGTLLNGRPVQVRSTSSMNESLVAVGLPRRLSDSPAPLAAVVRVAERSRGLRRLGSAALCLAYVASGRLDAFCGYGMHAWDVAAGVILIREAGGAVTDHQGDPYDPYGPDLLASNGGTHADLLAQLKETAG